MPPCLPYKRSQRLAAWVQTFLPYPGFAASAEVLDRRRLGKQRVEVLQVMKAILVGGGWSHHPVTVMWRGHEAALARYGEAVCQAWTSLGYADTCSRKISELLAAHPAAAGHDADPPWLGDERLHSSHRSRLLAKDFDWYSRFDWPETAAVARGEVQPYFWPGPAYARQS